MEKEMLKVQHLAVIRAALRYWDEEMGPQGVTSFRHYLEEPTSAGELTNEHVTFAREWLAQCELRYAMCNQAGTQLTKPQLFQYVSEAELVCDSELAQIVAVLVSTRHQ